MSKSSKSKSSKPSKSKEHVSSKLKEVNGSTRQHLPESEFLCTISFKNTLPAVPSGPFFKQVDSFHLKKLLKKCHNMRRTRSISAIENCLFFCTPKYQYVDSACKTLFY